MSHKNRELAGEKSKFASQATMSPSDSPKRTYDDYSKAELVKMLKNSLVRLREAEKKREAADKRCEAAEKRCEDAEGRCEALWKQLFDFQEKLGAANATYQAQLAELLHGSSTSASSSSFKEPSKEPSKGSGSFLRDLKRRGSLPPSSSTSSSSKPPEEAAPAPANISEHAPVGRRQSTGSCVDTRLTAVDIAGGGGGGGGSVSAASLLASAADEQQPGQRPQQHESPPRAEPPFSAYTSGAASAPPLRAHPTETAPRVARRGSNASVSAASLLSAPIKPPSLTTTTTGGGGAAGRSQPATCCSHTAVLNAAGESPVTVSAAALLGVGVGNAPSKSAPNSPFATDPPAVSPASGSGTAGGDGPRQPGRIGRRGSFERFTGTITGTISNKLPFSRRKGSSAGLMPPSDTATGGGGGSAPMLRRRRSDTVQFDSRKMQQLSAGDEAGGMGGGGGSAGGGAGGSASNSSAGSGLDEDWQDEAAAAAAWAATRPPAAGGIKGGAQTPRQAEGSSPMSSPEGVAGSGSGGSGSFVRRKREGASSIAATIRKIAVFAGLGEQQLARIVAAMEERDVALGEEVIVQGEPHGEEYYVVCSGKYDVYVQQAGPKPVGQLGRGDGFGELALLFDSPRSASVTCAAAGKVWVLGRELFQESIRHSDNDSTLDFLRCQPLLASLDDGALRQFEAKLQTCTYAPDEVMVVAGAKAEQLYLIKAGEVVVRDERRAGFESDDERARLHEVCRLQRGDYFGDGMLLSQAAQTHKVSYVAGSSVCAVRLSLADFRPLPGGVRRAVVSELNKRLSLHVPLLALLSDFERQEVVAPTLRKRVFDDGRTLVAQGSRKDAELLLIARGSVGLYKKRESGPSHSIGVEDMVCELGPGDVVGEQIGLGASKQPYSARARGGEVEAMVMGGAEWRDLAAELKALRATIVAGGEDSATEVAASFHSFALSRLNMSDEVSAEGEYCSVRMAHLPLAAGGGEALAVKSWNKRALQCQPDVERRIKREAELLNTLRHPYVARVLGLVIHRTELVTVQQLASGGSLAEVLAARVEGPRLTEAATCTVAAELASALEFLHASRVVHRELRPDNIWIDAVGHVVLAKLPSAKRLEVEQGTSGRLLARVFTICGAPEYMAPEMLAHTGYATSVDWWAIGVLVYELLCGFVPFAAEKPMDLLQKILAGSFDSAVGASDAAQALLRRLLVTRPGLRIGCGANGCRDVKRHAFFRAIDWRDVYERRVEPPVAPLLADPHAHADATTVDESVLDDSESLSPSTSSKASPSPPRRKLGFADGGGAAAVPAAPASSGRASSEYDDEEEGEEEEEEEEEEEDEDDEDDDAGGRVRDDSETDDSMAGESNDDEELDLNERRRRMLEGSLVNENDDDESSSGEEEEGDASSGDEEESESQDDKFGRSLPPSSREVRRL